MSQADFSGEPENANGGLVSRSPVAMQPSKSPEELSTELGPFSPPGDFRHGDEFDAEVPRPVPEVLRRGSFGRRKRNTPIILAGIGAALVISAPWQIVQNLSFYLLVLQYLNWAGYVLILIATVMAIQNRLSTRRYEYVRSGTPFIGRVLSVGHIVTRTVIGEPKQIVDVFRFLLTVEFDNPETGQHEFGNVTSEESWLAVNSSSYDAGVAAGQYVTLVALPGRISETLKLYGFLGLDPQRDFITHHGRIQSGVSTLTVISIFVMVLGFFWTFVGFLYLLTYCFPAEWEWIPGLISLSLGGIAGGVSGWIIDLAERKNPMRQYPTAITVFAFSLIGAAFGFMIMGLCNASFDRSGPTYEAVWIKNIWVKTQDFVFRHYEIEYSDLVQGQWLAQNHWKSVSYENLMRLERAKLAAKEIRQGAFGVKWIAGFHPCVWILLPDNPSKLDDQRAVAVDQMKWLRAEFKQRGMEIDMRAIAALDANAEKMVRIIPVLMLADGSFESVPDELVAPAKQELNDRLDVAN